MAEENKQPGEGKLQMISDELIEALSGGYIHQQPDGNYEIIDDFTGEVIDSDWFYNDYIKEYCKSKGVSIKMISDEDLAKLRGKWGPSNWNKTH